MEIVRTTYSCATAGGSNEARETSWLGGTQAKGRAKPLTTKARALIPQGVNSNRLRYAKTSVANLPKRVKPATCQGRNGKQALGGADRSGRRGRVLKETSETWETRSGGRTRGSPSRECIIWTGARTGVGGVHSSLKRGNARGAKEPCCMHAFINEERAA